ncbi:hypothetical protein NIES4074_66120 [Cylindrospermum sp. NIES-4074]|nr:hypothetical protein NIES4074_66120 [Cylindrospermum sp. NIES-4074]
MRLSQPQKPKWNKRAIWEGSLLSYLSLVGLWILANIYSEFLEEFSFWLETGFAIAQWLVLRRYLRSIGGWILVSVGGWVIAFLLIHVVDVGQWIVVLFPKGQLAIGGESVQIQALWTRSTIRLLEWTIIGLCQWLVLRRHVDHSSWWILASALGGAVKGPLEYIVGLTAENAFKPNVASYFAAISGALGYGIVTSIALVWLLREWIQYRSMR